MWQSFAGAWGLCSGAVGAEHRAQLFCHVPLRKKDCNVPTVVEVPWLRARWHVWSQQGFEMNKFWK